MALSTSWTVISYVKKTTKSGSKCCFGLLARVSSYDKNTAKYTIEFKPVVCGTNTLFYDSGGSSTTLYANGVKVAKGAPSPTEEWVSENITLGGTKYTKTGYLLDACSDKTPTAVIQGSFTSETTFYAYYTHVGGTANKWAVQETFNLGGNITLAKVTPAEYVVSYNANGGTGAPTNQIKYAGSNLTLSSTKPTKSNITTNGYTVTFNANGGSVGVSSRQAIDVTSYSFSSWKDSDGAIYSAGGTYTKNKTTTMTAQWSSTLTKGSIVLPTPSRDFYIFKGWSEDAYATSGITDSLYIPTKNTTLYAIWQAAKPYNVSFVVNNIQRTSADINISYTGVNINSIIIYYKKTNETNWKNVSFNTPITKVSLTELSPNINYNVYVSVGNPGGITQTSINNFMTIGNPPSNVGCTISNIFDYSVEIRCSAEADANASISKYELLNINTNTVWKSGTGSLFYLTDVKDETKYDFKVKAYDSFNRSTLSAQTYSFTTMKAKWIKIIDNTNSIKECRCYKIDANGNKSEIRKRFVHLIKK